MLSKKTMDIVKSTAPVLAEHGKTITSVFYRNMFAAHPELLNIFNHANQARGRQQAALANTVYAAAEHIHDLSPLLPAVRVIAEKHRALGVRAEHYPIVGTHLLGAIKEVLGDAATDDILQSWKEAYGVIADVFISVEKDMYEKAAHQPGGWDGFRKFVVKDKVKESDNITSFYLTPADGKAIPEYKPGQYINIRSSIPGEEFLFNRQYSLSCAPNSEAFRISVKRETDNDPNGRFSVYLHNDVKVGDALDVTAPAGAFYLDACCKSPVTLISGGVGITPLFAMLESLSKKDPSREVSVVQCSRNRNLHPFDTSIKQAIENMQNAKHVAYFSEEGDGFLTTEQLKQHLVPGSDVFLCGPVPFLQHVLNLLAQLGVPKEKVHFEFFGPSVNMEEMQ